MFEVEFIGNKIILSGKSYPLGQISCMVAEGDVDWISIPLKQITDWKFLRETARRYIEICFFSDTISKKTKRYISCRKNYPYHDQEYIVTKKLSEINSNGEARLQITDCYHIENMIELIDLEMMYATANNVAIRKCKNCGKYFATRKEGTIYCDRLFFEEQTCKQVGSKKAFTDKLKDNALLALYEKTYQAVYYKKRIAKNDDESENIEQELKTLKNYRMEYKKGTLAGEKFQSLIEKYSK